MAEELNQTAGLTNSPSKDTPGNPGFFSKVIPLPDATKAKEGNPQLDYLKIRTYLYKYTPAFTYLKYGARNSKISRKLVASKEDNQLKQINDAEARAKVIEAQVKQIKDVIDKYPFLNAPTFPVDLTDAKQNGYSKIAFVYEVPLPNGTTRRIEATDGHKQSIEWFSSKDVVYDNERYYANAHYKVVVAYLLTVLNQASASQKDGGRQRTSVEANKKKLTNVKKLTEDPFRVAKFSVDLTERFLSRFDISRFVHSYSCTQDINNGINWSVTLRDAIVTLNQLGPTTNTDAIRRPIYFPQGTSTGPETNAKVAGLDMGEDELIENISYYKTDVDTENFFVDAQKIEIAMRIRGIENEERREKILAILREKTSLEEKLKEVRGGKGTQVAKKKLLDRSRDGIALSDLIQKNDMITSFIYAQPLAAEILESALADNSTSFFDKEWNLLRPENVENREIKLYDVEFNGFVSKIDSGESAGRVNTVKISGGGITSLLNATRTIFSSTIFQGSIYDAAEILNAEAFSVAQNIFVEKTPLQIVELLLEQVYRVVTTIRKKPIDADGKPILKGTPVTDDEGNHGGIFNLDELTYLGRVDSKGKLLADGVNFGPKLLFVIPVYLLANVYRMRRFKTHVNNATSGSKWETPHSGGLIFETNDYENVFKSYFYFLSTSFGGYQPTTKTPNEVIKDIKDSSYLEFFESWGGRLTLRTPQYNNNIPDQVEGYVLDEYGNAIAGKTVIGQMLTSRQIKVISSTYTDTISGLKSKHTVGYATDLIGLPIEQLQYHYSNGKLISQYGLYTATTQKNPNVRFKPTKPGTVEASALKQFFDGIFQYCKFFLEMGNMNLKQGSIQVVGDPDLNVGKTFFDVANQKFGYITGVSKSLTVGGSYSATITLNMVRDAVENGGNDTYKLRPIFKRIPELVEIVNKFGDALTGSISSKQSRLTPVISANVKRMITAAAQSVANEYNKESASPYGGTQYNTSAPEVTAYTRKKILEKRIQQILKIQPK